MKATTFLKDAIEGLPVPSASCGKSELLPYFELIRSFGTHFTSVVTMGAKAVQRLTMTTQGMI